MNYTFLLTTYNDGDEATRAIQSLESSITPGDSYRLVIVDGGSTPEELAKITKIGSVLADPDSDDYKPLAYGHLSEALNAGYYVAMGFRPDGKNFNPEQDPATDYIFWIHTDCRFPQVGWANRLIEAYEECGGLVAKLGPGTPNIDNSVSCAQQGEMVREGNSCPHMMSSKFIYQFIEQNQYLFNPAYQNIGGFEDVDQFIRIKQMGYIAAIYSLSVVWHKGMGTRGLRDTNPDQIRNREIFHQFWGNNCEPPQTPDALLEINKVLAAKHQNLLQEVEVLTQSDAFRNIKVGG